MPRTDTPQSRQRLALLTYVRLMRATNSVRSFAAHSLDDTSLTLTQFAVLEALYHLGPMSLTDIAGKILTTGGNLTMVVGNLTKQGHVQKHCSPQDRRMYIVALTSKGKALMRDVFPKHAAALTAFFGTLSSDEQEQLGNLCRKLGKQER